MNKTFSFAFLFLVSLSALGAEPGSYRCDGREVAPGNQGKTGPVILSEHQASWDGASQALCHLEQFEGDACFITRSSNNLELEVNADCGELRFNIPMAEAHLTLARDHGRFRCIHRALGLTAELELSNCQPL